MHRESFSFVLCSNLMYPQTFWEISWSSFWPSCKVSSLHQKKVSLTDLSEYSSIIRFHFNLSNSLENETWPLADTTSSLCYPVYTLCAENTWSFSNWFSPTYEFSTWSNQAEAVSTLEPRFVIKWPMKFYDTVHLKHKAFRGPWQMIIDLPTTGSVDFIFYCIICYVPLILHSIFRLNV
jgi:hypothetical protein